MLVLFWVDQSGVFRGGAREWSMCSVTEINLLHDAKNRRRGKVWFSVGSNFSVLDETKAWSDSYKRDDVGPRHGGWISHELISGGISLH